MRDSNSGTNDRGNMERLGESAGAMAGRAADFGMEVTGALFRSAAEMLGGWWSSDAPRQAASWNDQAERNCRSHFQANAGGSARGGSGGGMQASGSVGGVSGSVSAGGSTGAAGVGNVPPKSQHAAMQSAGEVATDTGGSGGAGFTAAAQVGDTKLSGSAHLDTSSSSRGSSDMATDGFERARPGYQLGYVARRNPAYEGRSFSEIEPELQRVWESRAKTSAGGKAGQLGGRIRITRPPS
jgi:hypothetical protein